MRTLTARLRIESMDLAGNSMGGAIASLYARRYPSQVRSLAFIVSPLGIVGWAQGITRAIYRGVNPFIPISESQLDLELGLLFVTPPAIPETERKRLIDDYVSRNRHYVQVWNIVNLYNDVVAKTSPAPMPTLIVWGDDDRVFNVGGAEKLHRRIPGSELRRLPRAGHLLHFESAAEVAPLYVGFLKNGARPTIATAERAAGLANPASQNCVNKGGTLKLEQKLEGGEFGVCIFPDNLQCEEWAMMRGDCRTGGIQVTGFVTPAARYCAITGGRYKVTSGSNTPAEQGICTFKSGKTCDAAAYFDGRCAR